MYAQVGLLLVGLSSILRKNHTVSQWHTILGTLSFIHFQCQSSWLWKLQIKAFDLSSKEQQEFSYNLYPCMSIFLPLFFSGVILIIGSQVVSATQMVVEETFLKKRNVHPLHVSNFISISKTFLHLLSICLYLALSSTSLSFCR